MIDIIDNNAPGKLKTVIFQFLLYLFIISTVFDTNFDIFIGYSVPMTTGIFRIYHVFRHAHLFFAISKISSIYNLN